MFRRGIAIFGFILGTIMPTLAATSPALMMDDGSRTVTIDGAGNVAFGGLCTPTSCVTLSLIVQTGQVSWRGSIGTFNITFAIGTTKPQMTPTAALDLNLQAIRTTADGTITFKWTDTDFNYSDITGGTASVGGVLAGNGSSTYSAYFDNSNMQFGTGIPVTTVGPFPAGSFNGNGSGPGPTNAPFAMTQIATVTLTAGSSLGADFNFIALPAPLQLTCAGNSGQVGVPYSSSLMAMGGITPYTFSIINGNLPPGLTLNPSTGAITGTPTQAGTSGYTAQVVDSSNNFGQNTASAVCSIIVTSPPPLAVYCPISTGEVGLPYNSGISASGGLPPYTYSISAGTLPNGLSLNPTTGVISGTPTTDGAFNFTAQVIDSRGNAAGTATSNCTITISPPPSLTCPGTGTSGEVGVSFNAPAPIVTGGTPPYTFAINGTLPAGLTLNGDGSITGAPTASGTFSLKVTDSKGISAGGTCPYTIVGPPVLTCSATSSGEVGVAFDSGPMTVTGGTPSYTFFVATGTLPAGLSLNPANGEVTGTPTATGSFSIGVKDSNGVLATGNCPITIIGPPVLTCSATSSGEVGVAFDSGPMTVTGGTPTYTFFVATGTLPAGLSLNPANGEVTGTPTAIGSFSIGVKDSKGVVATGNCPITIVGPPVLTCSATSSGEVGVAFDSGPMTVTGGTPTYTFFVATGTLPAGLSLNPANGEVTGTPTAIGSFSIGVKDSNGVLATGNCPITIVGPPMLTCSAINSGTVGVFFNSGPMAVTGGTPAYTFSIASGALPAGLTLNPSTGAVSGTPLTVGSFTIKVTDARGVTATGTCAFVFTAPSNVCGLTWGYWKNHVSLWPVTSLVLGSQTYSQTELINLLGLPVAGDASINLAHQLIAAKFNVLNGTNPATDGGAIAAADSLLSTFSGKLPYNVSASSTVGTQMTTIAGNLDTFNSDGLAQPGCTNGPSPLAITCASGTGQVNVAYSSFVAASGGMLPYTFSIISGSLPPGLTLNPTTGAITGTPTTAGTYNYTVQVADATAVAGSSAGKITSDCSITIAPAPQPITIKCPAGTATLGGSYSSSATVSGGTGPYTFALLSGSLPPGLTLNTSTGAVTGTPTKSGTYTFTLKVVDSKGYSATSVCCSIAVSGGIVAGQFTTYTQGGWGAPPKGNNPGALLTANFTNVYSSSVVVGGTYKLTFTSALSIINFLPQGGTPAQLKASATNPTTSPAGVLAGQVLALQLSVDFSNKGITPTGLANLHVVSGPLAGKTVAQVLAIANSVLGGAAPPSGMTISDVNNVVDAINNNFDGGTTNKGYLQP